MKSAATVDWSGALIARLTDLWDEDLSINQIALVLSDETGITFTRNMVSGKAHRLALPRKPSPILPRKNPVKAKSPPPPWGAPPRPVIARTEAPKPVPATTLATSPATRCKWLMGQVLKAEKLTRRTMGGGRTWNSPQVTEPMKADPEPVFSCWAEVPQCPNERHPGKIWCADHCQRGYHNFVPQTPVQTEKENVPDDAVISA